ncbi:hypothetical protein TRAPUB_4730 [Trametes pubescens]|uniref:Uncharacterized protein n=1 Tax=Trametes pubescens TaxID=154538 RepID=A0A1M2V9X8_TRAPU|nr:hypothetical protein TRAPUB_4730 [Trametes pubescens]
MTERTAIALPLDPLQVLSQILNLPSLDVYEERWKVMDKDAVAYLKRQMVALQGRTEGAERHWKTDDDDAYDAFLLRRPMSPILSARARRETPHPEKGASAAKLPQSNKQMLEHYVVCQAQEIVPEETVVNTEEVLLANTARPSATHHFDDFLRSSSPPLDLPELEVLPIFPRSAPLGPRSGSILSPTVALDAMAQVSERLISKVRMREEDEEDLAEEHLVAVDGWQAFRTSSPATPSLADSSSEIDELFMPSSPGSELYRTDKLKMEVPQMPRSSRVGGAREQPLADQGNKLSEFLPPLVRPAPSCGPRIVQSPKSQPSSPRTSVTLSLLGQPSVLDVPEITAGSSDDDAHPSSDDSITFAIKAVERACGDRVGSEDPRHFILMEKLDEKDGMLMDVPLMRPPNEHPIGAFVVPCRLTDLLAPKDTSARKFGAERSFSADLKKAKGLQPLQIELSWIPFKYGRTVPTDEEVADVQNDPCPQLAKDIDLPQDEIVSRLAVLLDESMAFGSQPTSTETAPSLNAWLSNDQDVGDTVERYGFEAEQTLILTRQDRRRLAELPPFSDDHNSIDNLSQSDGNMSTPERPSTDATLLGGVQGEHANGGRATKRVRFQDPVHEEPTSARPVQAASSPEKYYAEDSGVFVYDSDNDSAIMSGGRRSFGQLSYDSEGFAGPTADGDLFQDVHFLHTGDYRFDYALTPGSYSQGFLPPYGLDTDILSPLRSDFYVLNGDGRDVEEVERAMAAPPLHQDPTHDRRSLLLPAATPLPAPLRSPTAVLPALTDHQTATFGSFHVNISDVRGSPRPQPELPAVFARPSLSHFLAICGKGSLAQASSVPLQTSVSIFDPEPSSPGVFEVQTSASTAAAHRSKDTPPELINNRTLVLPARYMSPSVGHRYMASLELIQKRALVRALTTCCAVELVEREQLGPDAENVHLILDCDTAVLFLSVESLPSRGEAVMALLTRLSWRFSRLLVVFECYPSSWNYKGDQDCTDKLVASAWSPPVVKAVKKLRRDLAIAEGVQTKHGATVVEYAFANTAQEAAIFVRMYGDIAETRDETGGALWGERGWLTQDERDGEYDLGGVSGMNIFVASLLLSQTTLEDFLEKSADDRLVEYAELAGTERMTRFNVEMARRLEAMQLPPSSPIDVATSSSSRDIGDSELGLY